MNRADVSESKLCLCCSVVTEEEPAAESNADTEQAQSKVKMFNCTVCLKFCIGFYCLGEGRTF